MYNKKIRNLLKKPQPNSGFTLTELLTGLIMSIFVTGALGFGLYQIMSATGAERAKANARTEASRAVEFISDELRRAQSIQVDNSITSLNVSTVAPNYNLPSGGTARLALNIPGVDQSIIYSVAPPPSGSPWKGPLVIYRWGPNLGNDGAYTNATNPTAWSNEALIDQVDNTVQSMSCGGTSVSYEGFFACIIDDDGDGVVENGTVDTNGDGKVDNNDSDDDTDGLSATAEIFLTGGIDANVIAGNDSNYTAKTKVVARAKDVEVNAAQVPEGPKISFRSLEADYVCNTGSSQTDTTDDVIWTMRTDFDNSPYGNIDNEAVVNSTVNRTATNMNKATKWIHEPDRQAQPIDINSNNDLTVYSIPIESTGCNNPSTKNNEGLSKTKNLSEFITDTPARHSVPHTIKFQPEVNGRANDASFYKTFNGNTTSGYDNPNVTSDGRVQVFKEGSIIEEGLSTIDTSSNNSHARGYPGYDPDGPGANSAPYRQSLGEFLASKGYATCIANCNASYNSSTPRQYQITDKLEDDERIIAFEVGHTDNGIGTNDADGNGEASPGFDLQDNIFIMKHDNFAKSYSIGN